ncbi:MAG: hypothetical protein A3B23_01025 [Candidatus Colwellbacteria bacterium RIFCSPLOWO2_01_FULL_48_10]|uniref:Uncharacterized protein n=2 Tax=Bacteria candidate phyla TaxID=1783234 RepID=A0A1F5P2Q4_9BACT|nr:MAG: hypothetical protein A2846_04065 [Candidatus Doudnabacteria bacterium RIFCSPHIGHO2_01_FULL_49_9]OGY59525.1 MAG: hypothetical protein A3B23_01025 [Candidatus Colwellbacteria bacterium RIFCSPLOWO2_01_FULL_48_10]
MKIFVTAKAKAREERVEQIDETHFKIAVKEPPIDGKANSAIARALAGHLGIPRSTVFLKQGTSAREKVFEIIF